MRYLVFHISHFSLQKQSMSQQAKPGEEEYVKGKLMMNVGDYASMLQHFVTAVALGNVSAMNDLAYYYQYAAKNETGAKDKVILYYTMAYEKGGNVNAAYNLGYHFYEQSDVENHLKWWKLASAGGNDTATFTLGAWYESQGDVKQAETYFALSAATTGNPKSTVALGDCLEARGQVKDAIALYMKALRMGYKDARYHVDKYLFTGQLTEDERDDVMEAVTPGFKQLKMQNKDKPPAQVTVSELNLPNGAKCMQFHISQSKD